MMGPLATWPSPGERGGTVEALVEANIVHDLISWDDVHLQPRQLQPALCNSPCTGLEVKNWKGRSTDTDTEYGKLWSHVSGRKSSLQSTALCRKISLSTVSSKTSYYYCAYFVMNVTILDFWAEESLLNVRNCYSNERQITSFSFFFKVKSNV